MDAVWPALILSLKVAGWATAITLLLGVAVGYLLARARFPGRDLLDTLLTLPMVMPPTVLGYYLLVLLGRQSAFGAWLQDTFGINLIFTWQGAVIAASVVAFPLVFKPARAASKRWTASWSRRRGCWACPRRAYSSGSPCRWPGAAS